jgi:hypothetical protein
VLRQSRNSSHLLMQVVLSSCHNTSRLALCSVRTRRPRSQQIKPPSPKGTRADKSNP